MRPSVPDFPLRTLRVLAAAAFALGPAASAESLGSAALVTPRPKPNEPYRFFGDHTVTVPLLIHAPEIEGLSIRAELVQLASHLSAPVAGELEVPLSGAAAAGPGSELDFTVPLPAVKRETDFELRFRSRRRGAQAWQAAGRIALRVYPADLLGPVRAWAESHPLRVEDDHGSLLELFRRHRIPVAVQPGHRGVTLYAGPRALEKRARLPLRDDARAVVFTESETEIPRLLIDRTGRGTTVRVEMRILNRLATDPLAQKVILEVFQLLRELGLSTEGVIP
jgi:hypothetical protein